MDALPGSIDVLAECPIKALYDHQVGKWQGRPHAEGEAQWSESPGGRNGRQGVTGHTHNLLAGRWLLAEEVHGMALGQEPRNEITDLTLATALQAKGAFDQADTHRRSMPCQQIFVSIVNL